MRIYPVVVEVNEDGLYEPSREKIRLSYNLVSYNRAIVATMAMLKAGLHQYIEQNGICDDPSDDLRHAVLEFFFDAREDGISSQVPAPQIEKADSEVFQNKYHQVSLSAALPAVAFDCTHDFSREGATNKRIFINASTLAIHWEDIEYLIKTLIKILIFFDKEKRYIDKKLPVDVWDENGCVIGQTSIPIRGDVVLTPEMFSPANIKLVDTEAACSKSVFGENRFLTAEVFDGLCLPPLQPGKASVSTADRASAKAAAVVGGVSRIVSKTSTAGELSVAQEDASQVPSSLAPSLTS